ncbi:MAG: NADH:flavin oxidoreductase [Coprobacillus sp.]
MYETISSPLNLGGIQLKNRIIFAPTTMGLSQEEYEKKLREIASGGCAMIIIGDVPVGKGHFSLFNKKGFQRYQNICHIIHEYDCLVCAQLHQSDSHFKGMIKYIPGLLTHKIKKEDLRTLLNNQVEEYITHLTQEKVQTITSSFGDAAKKALEAGFDCIQVHGDRMCGSFSSALFNHRNDSYGGSIEKRAQFAIESIQAIRKQLPNCPIDYKLVVRQENPHYGNAGVLLEELPIFIPLLESAGVTSFHVTLANHSNLEDPIPSSSHPYFNEEGCFLKFCDEVKKYTTLPICGVGGLTAPDFIEAQLCNHRIDCAAMSRQLIADPQWPKKVIYQQTDSIHHCIRCNQKCLGGMQNHNGVHCIYEKEEI